jgi:hypothetical protein
MAESKERRKSPRNGAAATPKPDSQAAAPRRVPSSAASMPLSGNVRAELPSEEMRRQIAETAYFRAKQRGFAPGHELEDWIEAESEVMGRDAEPRPRPGDAR